MLTSAIPSNISNAAKNTDASVSTGLKPYVRDINGQSETCDWLLRAMFCPKANKMTDPERLCFSSPNRSEKRKHEGEYRDENSAHRVRYQFQCTLRNEVLVFSDSDFSVREPMTKFPMPTSGQRNRIFVYVTRPRNRRSPLCDRQSLARSSACPLVVSSRPIL